MTETTGNMEEWRRLLEAAVQFKRQGSWSWMSDQDYFAVTDPGTGETGYCVTLGAGGMEFGLNVYVGPNAGLYLQELSGYSDTFGDDSKELFLSTNALTLNFEDRNQLNKEDYSLIRELGYKFRGSQEWPQFRSYSPGLVPSSLNMQQVKFLTIALEQAFLVAERFRQNDELYFEHGEADSGVGGKRLHRVPNKTADGILWHDEWLPWHVEGSLIEAYTYPDELALQQCKKLKKSNDVWQSDFDYAQMAIDDKGERPFYPRLCLWVSRDTSMIIGAHLVEQADCREQYVEQMIELLKTNDRKPARIEVGSIKALYALKHSAEKLGIPLQLNLHVETLLEAKDAINSNF